MKFFLRFKCEECDATVHVGDETVNIVDGDNCTRGCIDEITGDTSAENKDNDADDEKDN